MTKNSNRNGDEPRASTGIAGLDDVLGGGLPQGHLFLVEGTPGTGKTTMGLQFLLAGAATGEKTMIITLSETHKEIEGVASSHRWSMKDVAIFEFTPKEESLYGADQYSAFHPSEVEFQDTMQTILAEIEKVRPTRIVFDSLSEIRLLAQDSLRYRRQILALKHYFSSRNCTVVLLDAQTPESHNLESIAHGVLVMEMVQREYGVDRRRIRVAKLRGSRFREGFHDYSIVTGGVTVYPRLIAAEHMSDGDQSVVSSGIGELDALCGGGLTRGTSTLILGPAGTGKSSLAMTFATAAARRGERAAAFLFDETKQSAIRRSSRLGMNPVSLTEAGLLSLDQVDPAELSPGEFIARVRACVTEGRVRVLVIDSLNGLFNAMPGEGFLILQMHELLMYLNQSGVVTILIMAQAGLVGSMKSPADLSYLADNVLLLRYFESAGKVSKAVSVLKKRSGEHEDTIRELRLGNGGITVGPPLVNFHGILTGVPIFTESGNGGLRDEDEVE